MYICVCKGISDKQLEDARKSSKTIKDVCSHLGLGSECGACIEQALKVFQQPVAYQDCVAERYLNKNETT